MRLAILPNLGSGSRQSGSEVASYQSIIENEMMTIRKSRCTRSFASISRASWSDNLPPAFWFMRQMSAQMLSPVGVSTVRVVSDCDLVSSLARLSFDLNGSLKSCISTIMLPTKEMSWVWEGGACGGERTFIKWHLGSIKKLKKVGRNAVGSYIIEESLHKRSQGMILYEREEHADNCRGAVV